MNNFKSFVLITEQSKKELCHLDNWYRMLLWASNDPIVWEKVDSLTYAEASFLFCAVDSEINEFLLTEAPLGHKNKKGQMFGGTHHVEKKKKFMRPEEMGAATDELISDYQKFLQPRRYILALAKEKAKETGKSWEEVIGQVNPKDVVERMKQSGQAIDDEKKMLATVKSAIQNISKAPSGPGFGDFEKKITAPGHKESWSTTLRKHVKSQEPIIKAIKEIGADADTEDILDQLHQQKIEIVPKAMQKHLLVNLLQDLANKAEKDEPLSPAEQDVYKIWKSFAQGGPVRAIDAESIIRQAQKTGTQLFDQGELETLLVNKIKQEVGKGIAYEEDPEIDDKSQQKKWQRSIERWQTNKQTNPGETPYIVADYHGTDRARDPAIVAKYFDHAGQPNEYFYQQIAKPACVAIHQVLNRSMAIRGIPTISPLHITPSSDPTNPCGFSNPENEKGLAARNQFLDGETMDELFNSLVVILLNSTNLKGWEEFEGVRVRTAQIQALKMVENLMKKKRARYGMMKDQGASLGGALQRDIQAASRGGGSPAGGQYVQHMPGEEPETPDLMGPEVLARIMQNPEMAIARMQQAIAAEEDPGRKAQMQALLQSIQQKVGQQVGV